MPAFANQFRTVSAFTSCHDPYMLCTAMAREIFITCASRVDGLGRAVEYFFDPPALVTQLEVGEDAHVERLRFASGVRRKK